MPFKKKQRSLFPQFFDMTRNIVGMPTRFTAWGMRRGADLMEPRQLKGQVERDDEVNRIFPQHTNSELEDYHRRIERLAADFQARSPEGNQAIVFSGGGRHSAYGVGVAEALLSGASAITGNKPLDPSIMCGNSGGALSAAFLLSRWPIYGTDSGQALREFWINRFAENGNGNGAFRMRMNPMDFLNPANYLPLPVKPLRMILDDGRHLSADLMRRSANLMASNSTMMERVIESIDASTFITPEPLAATLNESICFENIRKSDKLLLIPATNWTTGNLAIFSNEDMTDTAGSKIISASCAVPGFFPAETMDGQEYVDGSVLMNTPLKAGIRAGAEVLHLINLMASVREMPFTDPPNLVETMFRQEIIRWETALENDLFRTKLYNDQLIEKIRAARVSGDPAMMKHSNGQPYRLTTVHIYKPSGHLGVGFTDMFEMRAGPIRKLVTRGFDDAVTHNCEEAGCIIPQTLNCEEQANE